MEEQNAKGWQRYHTIWLMLFIGWIVSYADRTLTGPIVTWMIANKVGFLQSAASPHALGGLLGSLFFAGYMLTQFPGGYFGDKFGYRVMIVISIFWAGITTIVTGLTGGLIIFVALRVLTGLGEGALYSNDRSLIAQVTPPKKLGLGMGLVMGGLTVGLTVALVGTVPLIKMANPLMGINAWKAPFLILGVVTSIVAFFIYFLMKPEGKGKTSPEFFGAALSSLLKYSIIFLIAIMGVYFVSEAMGLNDVAIAVILTCLAFALIAFIYKNKGSEITPVIKNKNLMLIYLAAIPYLWHLWFYGFWGGAVVKEFGGGTLVSALLVISFNAIAGVIGFPLGGKISDMVAHKHNGRRNVLAVLTGLLTIFIVIFAVYIMSGGKDMVVLSSILFISGLFYFAQQAVSHALTAETAPPELHGSAFGMWNLIAEIGAVLSPVVSGALRDSTGSWGAPLIVDGVLMGMSCLLVLCITKSAVVSVNGNVKSGI